MLEIQMAETHHPSNNYKCYQETKMATQINIPIGKAEEMLNHTCENNIISKRHYKTNINKQKIKSKKDKKEPFKIYFDHMKEESTPESSDSFASIEFDGKKYISLNVCKCIYMYLNLCMRPLINMCFYKFDQKFLEKAVKIPSDPDIKISQIESESDSESSISSDDSLFMTENIDGDYFEIID